MYKKTIQFLNVLEDQGRELEIASGRLRNGPGTAWAPGRSFANQKPSVLEHFWKPRLETANQRPGDTETRLQLLGLMDARLRFKSYQFWIVYGAAEPEVEI